MSSKDIGTLRTRLSWEDENANKSLEGFKRDLKGLRSEMNLAKSGGKDYTNSLKGMRSQSDILSRRFKTQQQQVKELRSRYKELTNAGKEDTVQAKNLASQINNTTAEMNRTEQQLKNLNAEIKRMESPWTKIGEKMTNTGDKLQTFGKHATDFGRSYSMRVTAPIVAGGVAMFKASMDYESAFAGIRKTVDMTEEEYESLSLSIRDMAKEIPAAATEIARVGEAAGQLGIENDAILGFTRTMVDLGVATNMSSDQAATALARFANITQMSQQDFDRLGSSVVDLGNNFATTESEIVDMSLRLAGAGAQIGMSEADILALATALSSVGIEAEMGGSAISRVMVNMQMATSTGFKKVQDVLKETGMTLRELEMMASHDATGFGEIAYSLGMTKKELNSLIGAGKDLENFSKIAGMTGEEFKKAFEKDAINALATFIDGLGNAENAGDSAINMLQEMGITEIRLRDSLLRAGGAHELLADSIDISSGAWKENTALANEAEERYKTTESQMKILWNRVKDIGITLGDALIPALMGAVDAAGPLIEKIESGAQAFADMDEEQQQTILKMIALAAAIGPASVGLGGLTTTIGGFMKAGGGVAKMLGKAGGVGMVGRIGLLAPMATSPVGLAVAGVGALALGTYALSKAMETNIEDTLKMIDTREAEINSTDELIASFEELQNKNRLSTDEMLRYMDIMTELKNAKSEEAIKALTDEQGELLKKSGLTNGEMEKFLELNSQVVEKSPETAKAISEQGNAYASVLDELKQLNEAERARLTDDTYMALSSELDKQKRNLEDQAELQGQIGDLEKDRSSSLDEMNSIGKEIRDQEQYILELKDQIKNASWQEKKILEDKLLHANTDLLLLTDSRKEHEKTIDKIDKQIGKKQKSLEETNKELEAFDELTAKYEEMVLFEAGLTAERGEGNKALDDAQKQIDQNRKELEKYRDANGDLTGIYADQNEALNEQQRKLDGARKKLEGINDLAGKQVYKDIKLRTDPSIDSIDRRLKVPVGKTVKVSVNSGPTPAMLAEGTDNHKGGPFIAGEEGFELGRMGNRWEWLNLGMYDRPRGYEVFTHDESKKIIQALNRMPAYASGVSSPGEADRVVGQLSSQPKSEPVQPAPIHIGQMVVREEADVKKIARELFNLQKGNSRVVLG